MYSSFDAVGLAVAAATAPGGEVNADRARFAPFVEAAERFAARRALVVGGPAATKLLLGERLGHGEMSLDLYGAKARRSAWDLADAFHALDPAGLGRYVKVVTRRADREFEVVVDARTLVRVHALEVHRGARVADIIVPTPRPAFYAEKLNLGCMGAEIQLISTYAALSNPARAEDWPRLVEDEVRLRALFDRSVRRKFRSVLGGRGRPRAAAPPDPLLAALLSDYAPRVGNVVVGNHAAAALAGGRPSRRLQVVASSPLKEEEEKIRAIATRLGYEVQATSNSVKVPSGPRLQRLTLYAVRAGGRRRPFVDVYDAGVRELVPFVGSNRPYVVGTPYVVLRFLLIDMWTILLLSRMSAISAQYAGQVLDAMLADVALAAEALVRAKNGGDFAEVFPTRDEDYAGHYQDPLVAAKRELRAAKRQAKAQGKQAYFPPYLPAKKRN